MAVTYTDIQKAAIRIARKWFQVEDATPDDDVVGEGLQISPEMIEAIIMVLTTVFECFANDRFRAWRRVRSYVDAKPMSRLGDGVRLLRICDLSLMKLGVPREAGDIKLLRDAIENEAAGLKQDDFNVLHTEALYLAI